MYVVCAVFVRTSERPQSHDNTAMSATDQRHPDTAASHSPNFNHSPSLGDLVLPTSPGNDGLPSLTSATSNSSAVCGRSSSSFPYPAVAVVKPFSRLLTEEDDEGEETHLKTVSSQHASTLQYGSDDETNLKQMMQTTEHSAYGTSQRHYDDDEEEEEDTVLKHAYSSETSAAVSDDAQPSVTDRDSQKTTSTICSDARSTVYQSPQHSSAVQSGELLLAVSSMSASTGCERMSPLAFSLSSVTRTNMSSSCQTDASSVSLAGKSCTPDAGRRGVQEPAEKRCVIL